MVQQLINAGYLVLNKVVIPLDFVVVLLLVRILGLLVQQVQVVFAGMLPAFDEVELVGAFLSGGRHLRRAGLGQHAEGVHTLDVGFDFGRFEGLDGDVDGGFGEGLHFLDEVVFVEFLGAGHLEVGFVGLHQVRFEGDC